MNNNIAFTLLASLIIGIFGATMAAVQFTTPSTPVFADGGAGSIDACEENKNPAGTVDSSVMGTGDVVSSTSAKLVTGVCIKTGVAQGGDQTPAFGDGHSDVLTANSTYENCYTVTGIGTNTVTVTRIDSEDCKDISHIDVIYGNTPTITTTITPTATPTASLTPTITATPEASLTPTITTTITPSVTTTVTPSLTESPTPTPTTGAGPTATPTPGPVGGTTTTQSVLGTTDTQPSKSVLGASTLAGTGTFDRTMANVFAMTAILFFILSGAAYAKKNR